VSRLLIVDGHAYAYRAFHAIRELHGPDGRPTNAIYGFIKMLDKMRGTVSPSHWIVVWDGGLSVTRLAALPEYKAQRPEMPLDLRSQLDEIVAYLGAASIPTWCQDGVEADDVIGTLASQTAATGWEVVIASSDKDFMQLVSDRIGLLNPNDKTGAIWTRKQVMAKTGVEPEQVADWLALMGDAVDNISGVPGVGPKTAAELLKQFGSVSVMLTRLAEVKSAKLQAVLCDSAALIQRNLAMVRLHHVPCGLALEQLLVQSPDTVKLRQLFQRWGFSGMIKRLAERDNSPQQAELI
jgi:DNA polymerase-1